MYQVYCVRTTLEPFPNFVKGSAGRRYDIVMLKALLGEEDQDADTNSCLRRAAFAMPANYGAVPAGSEVEPRRRRRRAVAFSPDGSRLARAEGNLVVVCDTTTGFVECTLSGHWDT